MEILLYSVEKWDLCEYGWDSRPEIGTQFKYNLNRRNGLALVGHM